MRNTVLLVLACLLASCSTPEAPPTTTPVVITDNAKDLLFYARDAIAPVLSSRPGSAEYFLHFTWNWQAYVAAGEFSSAWLDTVIAEIADPADIDAQTAVQRIAAKYRELPADRLTGSAICAGTRLALEDCGAWLEEFPIEED